VARYPWAAFVLLALLFSGGLIWAVEAIGRTVAMVDHGWAYVLAGVAVAGGGLLLARSQPFLAVLVVVTGPIVALPPRNGGSNPFPLEIQLAGLGLIATGLVYLLVHMIRTPVPAARVDAGGRHRPEVVELSTEGGAHLAPPLYVAACACSWSGDPRATADEAAVDAREHAERPDGRGYA